jgi:hypothetical protein
MATHLKLFGAISAVRRVIISLVAIYADEPTDHDSTQRVDAMDYSPISRFAWARSAAPWGMTGIRRRKSPPLRLSLALELSGQSRNVYQQFTADPKAVQAMMLTGCPSGRDGFPTLIGALRNGDHSDRADCPICSPQYPNLRRARSRPVPMGLCAVSRWCEGCRNKGKARLSSALDRISERITLAFQTLSRPEAIRGTNRRKTTIYLIFQQDMAEMESVNPH